MSVAWLAELDMHSGDMTELEAAELSQQEKDALTEVMERAKVIYNYYTHDM